MFLKKYPPTCLRGLRIAVQDGEQPFPPLTTLVKYRYRQIQIPFELRCNICVGLVELELTIVGNFFFFSCSSVVNSYL